MKNRYFLSAFVAAMVALPGLFSCNSEVFIDDFAPSDESILVPSDGHAKVIDFKSDSWNIFDVYTVNGDAIKGDVYDADGQRLGDDPMYVEPGWTKFVLDHPAVTLTVERTKGDKLCVTSTENASGRPFECFIDVGNDYDRRYIRVEVEPSEAYQLDSIVYRLNSWLGQDSVPWHSTSNLVIPYPKEEPATYVITPYERQSYQVQFTFYDDNPLAIFGGNKPDILPVKSVPTGGTNSTGWTSRCMPATRAQVGSRNLRGNLISISLRLMRFILCHGIRLHFYVKKG